MQARISREAPEQIHSDCCTRKGNRGLHLQEVLLQQVMESVQAPSVLTPLVATRIFAASRMCSTAAAAAASPREVLPDKAGRALRAGKHAARVGA